MTIGIDFDGTWTEDPALWRDFTLAAMRKGHRVVMVTARREWAPDMQRHGIPGTMQIIYTNHQLKEQAALKAGVRVDVWIDDTPGMIQDCRVIQPSPDETL